MTRLLIIGGSDAGISAALRARELDPDTDVTVLLADDFPNYSICGLPFFLSGEVADWRALAHRTREELLGHSIRLLTRHTATAIRPDAKEVLASGPDGQTVRLPYDKLVLATGAASRKPAAIRGHLPGVFLLRWMTDSFDIDDYLRRHAPASALIAGGGYIGLEMADALTRRGLAVTVAGRSVLKTVDPAFGSLIRAELERNGVRVASGVSIEAIEAADPAAPPASPASKGGALSVSGSDGFRAEADMVLVAAGAEPATGLARSASIALGQNGAIAVNRRMETSLPDVHAAGDCVETWHRLLGRAVYLPLGTTAHKQGRIAGENALGGQREFAGSLGTQVVKIFDLAVARTGLLDREAQAEGLSPLTVRSESWDHKAYYPGAHRLHIRVTGDRATGRLLGAQIIGHWRAEVAKRIDVFATALFHGMRVEDMDRLDLSYTPPLGSPWDPVQLAAQAWCAAASAAGGQDG